jgi:hypothetical protein
VVHALSFGSSHIMGTENGVGCKERKRAPSVSPASPRRPAPLLISFPVHTITFILFVWFFLMKISQ